MEYKRLSVFIDDALSLFFKNNPEIEDEWFHFLGSKFEEEEEENKNNFKKNEQDKIHKVIEACKVAFRVSTDSKGGCKVLSLGDGCKCALCNMDKLHDKTKIDHSAILDGIEITDARVITDKLKKEMEWKV